VRIAHAPAGRRLRVARMAAAPNSAAAAALQGRARSRGRPRRRQHLRSCHWAASKPCRFHLVVSISLASSDYVIVTDEAAGRTIPNAFLDKVKDDFVARCGPARLPQQRRGEAPTLFREGSQPQRRGWRVHALTPVARKHGCFECGQPRELTGQARWPAARNKMGAICEIREIPSCLLTCQSTALLRPSKVWREGQVCQGGRPERIQVRGLRMQGGVRDRLGATAGVTLGLAAASHRVRFALASLIAAWARGPLWPCSEQP
jgi:hypothetical protein